MEHILRSHHHGGGFAVCNWRGGPPPIGGATAAQWALATKTERDGIVPLAVDFLRYVTAPQNAGPDDFGDGTFLPNIKGVDVNPDLKEPLRAITEGLARPVWSTYPDKIGTEQREKIAANLDRLQAGRRDAG